MTTEEQILLKFNGADFIRTNFYSYQPFSGKEKIKIDVSAKVYYPENDKRKFEIIMSVSLSVPEFFQLSLDAVGHFEFHSDLDEKADLRKQFVNVNAPAILFPYIRAFITTFSSNLGNTIYPLVIPTRFFKGDIEEFVPEEDPIAAPNIELPNAETGTETNPA